MWALVPRLRLVMPCRVDPCRHAPGDPNRLHLRLGLHRLYIVLSGLVFEERYGSTAGRRIELITALSDRHEVSLLPR